jgi:hypothetical protein
LHFGRVPAHGKFVAFESQFGFACFTAPPTAPSEKPSLGINSARHAIAMGASLQIYIFQYPL